METRLRAKAPSTFLADGQPGYVLMHAVEIREPFDIFHELNNCWEIRNRPIEYVCDTRVYKWCMWYRCINVYSRSNNLMFWPTLQWHCYSQIFKNLNYSYVKYTYRCRIFTFAIVYKYLFSSFTTVGKALTRLNCIVLSWSAANSMGISPIFMQNYDRTFKITFR